MPIPGFHHATAAVNGQTIAYSHAGSGPPILLLHGFPQTRAMWHAIAPALAHDYTVIAADLRGYGDSSKPKDTQNYSFRHMAADQHALMQHLGHDQFHLIGHDRGARTAHRLSLDTPDALLSLSLMDIIPTHSLLDQLHRSVAKAYYHWFFLAQPEPFPEHFISSDPDHYYQSSLLGWGHANLTDFDPQALTHYRNSWRNPETIRAMCDDYRATLDIDFALDAADLDKRFAGPALIAYGKDGAMGQAFDVPATWADRLTNIQSAALPGGHFFPDTHPKDTIKALTTFLNSL